MAEVATKKTISVSESREETITTSTTVTSPGTKVGNKTKKKKIEGVAGNDASPNLTPRTKKTKKSKKNELEKENISVKSSFNKFDALSKKTVLHVRSIDAGKVQQQLNAVGQNGDTNPNCRSCGKVVFQMEQTKAEGLVWHKNCFRCVQCSKQLNVDNYESHESTLYCKPHFKELFQPKPVEESEQPVRPRKPELIIRENEPKELPPDVVRASDKPDLGLEELSSLNVKSRFQVFEKAGTETNEIERSPSQIAVKRSPSILSKLAKFQAKGMDIGVADESLNGIPYEESSESEEEEETEETEEVDSEIVKAKRTTRERPISFTKMDDIKNRWESTSQQGRKEVQREARKEEIAGIRSRLFMGKQGKMKEMYQQAVAGSERVTKINAAEELQHSSTHARSIKERFERGEPIAASDDETDSKPKPEKADEEVIAAGISRKSRSMFLELDASAAKTGRPVTPVNPKTPAEAPRRARDAFMGRQVSDDVVRSSDTTEEVHVETSDISNKFKFFESYKEPEKQRKQFRITPPRDGQVKMDSPEREIYRDPDVVRAEDRVDEVVHTDTARKMLSIFRQMEENACKQELPNGPKPLKRFTPPPEDKFAKPTASDSEEEEEEEEEGEESEGEDSGEEKDPNYVRASDKVEDEFLKQAQNAARAKTLCAKFEHWDETDAKTTTSSGQHIAEMEIAQNTGDQTSIESASSLRARFESLGSQTNESPRTPKVKVNRFVMEICIDSLESAQNAIAGGATRLEVCSVLSEGGLTPTPGFLKKIKTFSPVPIYSMLRTRSGNFVYSIEEIDVMVEDLEILKDHGTDGFVFGALTSNDEIDVESCKRILSAARPLPVTFHRAFDEVADPSKSLELLIELGFERILTSGQKDTALEGLELIKKLVRDSRDKIIVMPGSGIDKDNILKIKIESGAKEFHASAKRMVVTSDGRNKVKIGASKETNKMVTDRRLVQEMVDIIRNAV